MSFKNNEYDIEEQFTDKDNYSSNRERSPIRGARPGKFSSGDKFKILLKNLPYSVNWMKLKDICKEHCAGTVIFADIIKTRDGRSAGFGHAEFKTLEEAKSAVEKLHGMMLDGRDVRCDLDINDDQLHRMCRKQGLDFRSERQQQWDAERAERRNQRGNGGYSRDTGYGSGHQQSYGGGPGRFPGDDGPYGGENRYGPMRSVAPSHQVPMINGRPLTEYPGFDNLSPSVMDAIGAGPVGKNIFVRNLDYKVDEDKMKEVFGLAGTVEEVSLTKDQDGKSRGMGVVSFSQPMEAVKAVVMFHTQALFGRAMYCKMDRKNNEAPKPEKKKLPEGLAGLNVNPDILNLPTDFKPAPASQVPVYNPPPMRDPYGGYQQANNVNAPMLHSHGSGCVITVDRLPPSATQQRLRRLFEDTGRVAQVHLTDFGRAEIRFESAFDAERAVGRFNGYMIEGHQLSARITD
ncbi:Oidioi.mRNA.OKI2018_I69.chr2.g5915.t2.cds [Oikopleura dioica]|uniref:Oidioi.mRNA.OKI2018_I69.chr2.g5915.t2.cds n=1 Tax=Oikopleura dioica TaxID=34765 RepID=A0ABN7T1S9_OIKDI|nr:Oidioi.mRNA.OKI2018_I69.chr2.g5915.t2.cds [Oikopleura dioica]